MPVVLLKSDQRSNEVTEVKFKGHIFENIQNANFSFIIRAMVM